VQILLALLDSGERMCEIQPMKNHRKRASQSPVPSDEEIAGLLNNFPKKRPRWACRALAAFLETDISTLRRWMKGASLPGDEDKRTIAFLLRPLYPSKLTGESRVVAHY
jgi:hypothetical protein